MSEDPRLGGIVRLYGAEQTHALANSHVAVIGHNIDNGFLFAVAGFALGNAPWLVEGDLTSFECRQPHPPQ